LFNSVSEVFADPSRWTQGVCAIDAQGKGVGVNDRSACSWCVYGAAVLVHGSFSAANTYLNRVEAAIKELYGIRIGAIAWQDRMATHEQLLAVCRRADA
jgi:hypothetical protein